MQFKENIWTGEGISYRELCDDNWISGTDPIGIRVAGL